MLWNRSPACPAKLGKSERGSYPDGQRRPRGVCPAAELRRQFEPDCETPGRGRPAIAPPGPHRGSWPQNRPSLALEHWPALPAAEPSLPPPHRSDLPTFGDCKFFRGVERSQWERILGEAC